MKDQPQPEAGDVWRHYKGGFYVVLVGCATSATNGDKDGLTCVVYRALGTSNVYVRSRLEFLDDVDGMPRFALDYRRHGVGDLDNQVVP